MIIRNGKLKRLSRFFLPAWMLFFFVLHAKNTFRFDNERTALSFFAAIAMTIVLSGIVFFAYRLFITRNEKGALSVGIPSLLVITVFTLFFLLDIGHITSMDKKGLTDLPGFFLSFLDSVSVVSIFLASAFVVGNTLLERFSSRLFGKSEALTVSVALGIGVWGYFIFLLDVLGIAYPWVACLFAIGAIIIRWKKLVKLGVSLSEKKMRVPSQIRLEDAAFVIIIALALLCFVLSYSSLAVGGWDTFHQYLTFPDAYARHHSLVPFPFHPHWGFPQLSEMIFQAGLLLGETRTPFLLNCAFIVLGAIGFGTVAKSIAGKAYVWPLATLASVPLLLRFAAGYLKVESALFLYVVALFIVLKKIFENRTSKDRKNGLWILVGIIFGLLLSVKYTSVIFVAALFVSLVLFRKTFGFDWHKAVLVSAISLFIFSPWLIKDQIYYGNPLYPLFPGKDFVSAQLRMSCQPYFVQGSNEDIFLTLHPEQYRKDAITLSRIHITLLPFIQGNGSDVTGVGPFFIIFLPPLIWLLRKTKDPYPRFLLSFSAIFFALGACFFMGQTWYLLPMTVPFLLALAYVWKEWEGTRSSVLARYLVFAWIFFVLAINAFASGNSELTSYARNETSMGELLESIGRYCGNFRRYDAYAMWQDINRLIRERDASDTLVYGFMDPQGYFIDDSFRHFIPDFFGYLSTCLSENGGIADGMQKLGVTHVLFDSEPPAGCVQSDVFLTCRAYYGFQDYISTHGTLIKKEGAFELYSVE
ncbi:MAG: hypothetical protein WCJ25_04310 [Candidatus Moraniibacteriota bacterium]